MPYPEQYTTAIFIAIIVAFAAMGGLSVAFYNTLYSKDALSDKEQSRKAKNPLIYLISAAVFGGVGVFAAMKDISADSVFLIVLIPVAVSVCVCDALNGFVPLIGVILSGITLILKMIYDCFAAENLSPLIAFLAGALVSAVIFGIVKLISVKTGKLSADIRSIVLTVFLFGSLGVTIGLAVIIIAEILAFLTYVLPKWLINKKSEQLFSINYPLLTYLFPLYYFAMFVLIIEAV